MAMSGNSWISNFVTTVTTPTKNPGLDVAQRQSVSLEMTTVVDASGWYISDAFGAKRRSTPIATSFLISLFSSLGYSSKSSSGRNCLGFTNIVAITRLHFCCAILIRDRCPSCKAPIVGTKPIVCPSTCQRDVCCLNSAIVRKTSNVVSPEVFKSFEPGW